ncbi:MAG: hypothetical protein JEZ11_25835 [Desulfobacterales bacterium]|nr:hypothetical protein [Desulfobacterales bacterium]
MPRANPFTVPAAVLVCLVVFAGTSWAAAGKNTLALFNLRPTNMEAMGQSGEILFTLVSALEQEKTVDVMPRREMEEMLYQKGLVQGDNAAAAAQAGKVLGVEFVLFGQVTEAGGRISSRLQLMDVKTGRVRRAWTPSFADRDAILAQAPAFARELADAMASGAGGESPGTLTAAGSGGPSLAIQALRGVSRGDRIFLTWKFDSAMPVSGFHVYRSEGVEGPYQFMGGTREGRYEDPVVKKGTTYYYRVGILSVQGQEVKHHQTVMVKHSGEKTPHSPLLMDGTGHVRRVVFKFVPSLQNQQENFTITTYPIYRRGGQDGQWRKIQSLDAGKKSQYELAYSVEDHDGLDDGLAYEYSVASEDREMGESPLAEAITLTTVGRPVLKVRQDELLRKVLFQWVPLDGVDGYRLYRKDGGESWQKVGERRSSQSSELTDDRGLADGIQYAYYLTAYDKSGETGPSETVHARTKDLPSAPAGVKAEGGRVKSVRLTWTALPDPDVGGYAIYRGTEAKQLEQIDKVRGHDRESYTDKGSGFSYLEDGTPYFYAVESYNLFGADGELSPVVSATTKPRPQAVQELVAVAAGDAIVVTWRPNPESDIRGNSLYRSQDQGSWSKLDVLPPDQTRFSDKDLKPGVSYRYQLIAEDPPVSG